MAPKARRQIRTSGATARRDGGGAGTADYFPGAAASPVRSLQPLRPRRCQLRLADFTSMGKPTARSRPQTWCSRSGTATGCRAGSILHFWAPAVLSPRHYLPIRRGHGTETDATFSASWTFHHLLTYYRAVGAAGISPHDGIVTWSGATLHSGRSSAPNRCELPCKLGSTAHYTTLLATQQRRTSPDPESFEKLIGGPGEYVW